MDPHEYRDARWYALLRAAADLGVPDEDAPALVAQVLAANRRSIKRAEDPDPLVHDALRDAVLGPPPQAPSRRWVGVVALAAALVGIGVVVAVTRPDPPPPDRLRGDQVPSLFGYDGSDARALLEDRGLRVTVQPFRACEVYGRAVGSDPPAGTPYDAGDPITLYTSLPADVACLTDYQDRAASWQLLDFANHRGPAPTFADRVFVYPGDGPPLILDHAHAEDPDGWATTGVLDALRAASGRVSLVSEHPLSYAIPAVHVVPVGQGAGGCGVPTPAVAGTADVFALTIQPPERTGCPLRVEVYREDGAIVAIAYDPGSG
ncbi:PASTA domain-containing protein [Nocardioides sp.]|uniref:Stk1 family PASTA domain-containing Ser/Thr kinase n=1 Tax=Nocardioides sp. TaxID=35761 RepID=UPI003783D5D4